MVAETPYVFLGVGWGDMGNIYEEIIGGVGNMNEEWVIQISGTLWMAEGVRDIAYFLKWEVGTNLGGLTLEMKECYTFHQLCSFVRLFLSWRTSQIGQAFLERS